MTGFDIVLLIVLIAFALLGLRHGSVWIISCLAGGFLGAYLVEYYALPATEWIGTFAGAKWIACVLLFLGGVLLAVIPGWVVSRLAGMFCVGALDKMLGVFAGLLAGLVAVMLAFMILLPRFPLMERSASWRRSHFARPLCDRLQRFFGHSSRQRATVTDEIKTAISEQVTPVVNKTTTSIKTTAHEAEHAVEKKAKAMKKAVTGDK